MHSNSKKRQRIWSLIVIDLLMIFILTINLLWIIFDWFFAFEYIKTYFAINNRDFYEFYSHIHHNFWFYDLIFVAIFITEILVRWAIAIKNRTYFRWFFYPFAHWYDVLGCIPVGSFLILRFLRVGSIIYRLHKLEIIDITKNYIYQAVNKYYLILVEEISDRVVINVLNGMQNEFKRGTPLLDKIIKETILPHKDVITQIVTEKIQNISSHVFEQYQYEIQIYINGKVKKAIDENTEMNNISRIPVLGTTITTTLEKSISEIVYNIYKGVITDITLTENRVKLNEISGNILESLLSDLKEDISEVTNTILVQAIDIIKEQVKIQQWKVKEIEEKEKRIKEKQDKKSDDELRKLEKEKRNAVIQDPIFPIDND